MPSSHMSYGAESSRSFVYNNYRALMRWQAVNYLDECDYLGIFVVHVSERIKHPL